VSTYRLKEDTHGRAKKSFIKSLPLVLLASLPALIMAFIIRKEFPFFIYFMLFALMSATVIAYFLSSKRRSSFLLTIDQDRVNLHQSGKRDVIISTSEIKKNIDEDSGIRIKSIDPTVEIYIPNDLEDYEKLKTELTSWAIIESGQKNKSLQIIVILFVCFLLIGGYITKNPIFGYTLIALLGGYCVFLYTQNFKALMVTKDRWKRVRIIISFILFGLITLNYILNYIK
jgi:hypothetical protein